MAMSPLGLIRADRAVPDWSRNDPEAIRRLVELGLKARVK